MAEQQSCSLVVYFSLYLTRLWFHRTRRKRKWHALTRPSGRVRSPITSTVPGVTALGGQGFERDAKSELFLLAVSNMVNPGGAFHENGKTRDARYTTLIAQTAPDTEWFTGFLGFLRDTQTCGPRPSSRRRTPSRHGSTWASRATRPDLPGLAAGRRTRRIAGPTG